MKRFWAVTDERGLIARLVDEVGATYWQARWDATAWRKLVGVPQPDMWVPFGFEGQLILDGTEAGPAPGSSSLRPAIVLNQLRAYDPLFGAFLQPDPADQTGRLLPEGYLYGRGDYVERVDATGAYSKDLEALNRKIPKQSRRSFDDSCVTHSKDVYDILKNQELYNQIAIDIDTCTNGVCGDVRFGPNVKKQWKMAILTGRYFCAYSLHKKGVEPEPETKGIVQWDGSLWQVAEQGWPRGLRLSDGAVLDTAWARTATDSEGDLFKRQTLVGTQPKDGCWARTVAHEAMHGVIDSLPIEQAQATVPLELKGMSWGSGMKARGDDLILGKGGLEDCIRCNQMK